MTRLARFGWTAYGATLGLTLGVLIGATVRCWPDLINQATTHRGRT